MNEWMNERMSDKDNKINFLAKTTSNEMKWIENEIENLWNWVTELNEFIFILKCRILWESKAIELKQQQQKIKEKKYFAKNKNNLIERKSEGEKVVFKFSVIN